MLPILFDSPKKKTITNQVNYSDIFFFAFRSDFVTQVPNPRMRQRLQYINESAFNLASPIYSHLFGKYLWTEISLWNWQHFLRLTDLCILYHCDLIENKSGETQRVTATSLTNDSYSGRFEALYSYYKFNSNK